jgi:aryl-alcohol dehydrogenase-like predicted oxidoreductase
MKQNRLGNSGLFISEIGLGCMSLGTDTSRAIRLIHQALDEGITFLDTADLYDYGKNEEIVGKAIKGKRDQVILATKGGNRWQEGGSGSVWDASKNYLKSAVKQSLRRLQCDYIDLYQLHGGTLEDPIEETIQAFEELKQEGLIREYGISSIRPNVIREYVSRSHPVSVMLQYSILDRRPEEELLDLLGAHGISVIARGPLAKGYLSERVITKEKQQGYLDYSWQEIINIVENLHTLTTSERRVVQTALRYCLAHPAVASAIPGASQVEQITQNTKASKVARLTGETIKRIQGWSRATQYKLHR